MSDPISAEQIRRARQHLTKIIGMVDREDLAGYPVTVLVRETFDHLVAEVDRHRAERIGYQMEADRLLREKNEDRQTIDRLTAEREALRQALSQLRIDANRLCDRNLGGTYEEDCRRSLDSAKRVLAAFREGNT